jgi:predicted Rossmann-fold nucleotide-binding protein
MVKLKHLMQNLCDMTSQGFVVIVGGGGAVSETMTTVKSLLAVKIVLI